MGDASGSWREKETVDVVVAGECTVARAVPLEWRRAARDERKWRARVAVWARIRSGPPREERFSKPNGSSMMERKLDVPWERALERSERRGLKDGEFGSTASTVPPPKKEDGSEAEREEERERAKIRKPTPVGEPNIL
jgi:hypothetical protein